MRPKAPKPGKRVLLERISPIWTRLSFIQKVSMRNLFRYKRRFWMTVAGIGGCTALVVTGLGLRDSIFDILAWQFDEITCYDAALGISEEIRADEKMRMSQTLESMPEISSFQECYQSSLDLETHSGKVEYASVICVDDLGELDGHLYVINPLYSFYDLNHRLQTPERITVNTLDLLRSDGETWLTSLTAALVPWEKQTPAAPE